MEQRKSGQQMVLEQVYIQNQKNESEHKPYTCHKN